jgi:hypothetical protein
VPASAIGKRIEVVRRMSLARATVLRVSSESGRRPSRIASSKRMPPNQWPLPW